MVFNMKLSGFFGSGGRGDQTRLVHDKGGLVNVRDDVDGCVGVKDIVGFDFFTFERRGGLKGDSFPGTGTRTSRDDAAVLPLFVAVGFDTQEETTVIFQGVGMAADEGGHLGESVWLVVPVVVGVVWCAGGFLSRPDGRTRRRGDSAGGGEKNRILALET